MRCCIHALKLNTEVLETSFIMVYLPSEGIYIYKGLVTRGNNNNKNSIID